MKEVYPIKTKYGTFDANIRHYKREKRYFVTIPAFPGPMTEARTLAEAKKYAGELIALACLEAIEKDKLIVDNERKVYGSSVRPGVLTA